MASRDAYRALARRLEAEARTAPGRYRLRLALLAGLGYGVLVGLLLLALAPLALVAAHVALGGASLTPQHVFVVVLPAAIGAVLLRALWMRIDPPAGHRLDENEAPQLRAEVERLRREVGAPPLEAIILDGELNAGAAYVPRLFGLLGHRHYLVIGLPLLRALDRDELASVIAHEFGHFGGQHGRFAGWIYRVRESWHRVLDGFAGRDLSFAWLLARFYAWYVPYFNAYSFVLARDHEYRADAAAARAAGAESAASALVRVELAARRLQVRFWPAFWARARTQHHPPAQIQAQIARAIADPEANLERLLALATRDADPDDTHPTLRQRLDAIGAAPALRSGGTPAVELLGAALDRIERRLDEAWRDAIRGHWQALHAAAAGDRARLAELEALGEPTPAEQVEHARLVETLRIDFDPLPLYERALARSPDSALALFHAGLLQLRRGCVQAGAGHLRRAIALDAGATGPLLDDIHRIDADPDLEAAVAETVASLRAEIAPQADALAVREGVGGDDELLPHDLDADALRRLVRKLACEERVARAWAVRKRMPLREAPAHYVILLDWRGSVASEDAGLKRLAAALDLPGSHTLFTASNQRRMAQRVREACGSPVYRRGGR